MFRNVKDLKGLRSVLYKLVTPLLMMGFISCLTLPQYEKVTVDGVEQYIPKELLNELPDFAPKEETKKDDQKSADESPTEELENDLADTFSWLAKVTAVLAVGIGALGFIHPGLGKLGIGRWMGLMSLCSMGIVYATGFMWYFIGGAVFILLAYLLWKIYRIVREKVELEMLSEKLADADRATSRKMLEEHRSTKCLKKKNTKI